MSGINAHRDQSLSDSGFDTQCHSRIRSIFLFRLLICRSTYSWCCRSKMSNKNTDQKSETENVLEFASSTSWQHIIIPPVWIIFHFIHHSSYSTAHAHDKENQSLLPYISGHAKQARMKSVESPRKPECKSA